MRHALPYNKGEVCSIPSHPIKERYVVCPPTQKGRGMWYALPINKGGVCGMPSLPIRERYAACPHTQ